MKVVLVCLLLLISLCGVKAQGTLIFFDDFNTFNFSIWQHELTLSGGGNWEFEYYTNNRSNSFVENSTLYILPTLTCDTIGLANLESGFTMDLWGGTPADLCTGNDFYGCERTAGGGGNILNPIQSAAVRSVNSFNFQYGTIEIRAKLPRGDWLWPAIWLLPRYNIYGDWPASGEIDLIESRGNDASYSAGGVNQYGTTLHWGPFWPEDAYALTHATYTLPSGDFSQEFHLFGTIWTQKGFTFYLDDPSNVVLNVVVTEPFWELGGWSSNPALNNPWVGGGPDAPFDQEYYLIINVACGGTNGYFPDGVGGKPWSDTSPNAVNEFWAGESGWLPTWQGLDAALQVDYIKIYQ